VLAWRFGGMLPLVARHASSASESAVPLHPETAKVLERIGKGPGRWRRRLAGFLVLVLLAGGAGAWWWSGRDERNPAPQWETVTADRGDIEIHVVATGSLQARSVVSVGAETSGRVAEVTVDVNDHVTKGQVLVRLDPETAANTLAEARASAKAAAADVSRSRAALSESKSVEDRVGSLAVQGLVSAEEEHTQHTNAALAENDVTRAKAQSSLAKIRVDQAKTNLSKLEIFSPIDGIVMSRTVEPGNALSASLAAPVLFTIAEDLSKMELALPVNEADVGRVRTGQAASFRVDAWPDRVFEARVLEVSFAPVVTNNVVTYTALLEVDNADLALRPGMTATATIVSDTRQQVLRVPNTALRYTPPETKTQSFNPLAPQRMRGGGGGGGGGGRGGGSKSTPPGVWVLRDGAPVRVRVTPGVSDGTFTEITAGEVAEGDEIVIGQDRGSGRGAS
jgi:HlyD family secretion protein